MFYILIVIPFSHPFSETVHLMFSSPEPSVYACSGVRCRHRCRQQCLNDFLPIKAKLYVEPPWEGGTKAYINASGHMTKMAAMSIYEPRHEKTNILHIRKQRRRSASR